MSIDFEECVKCEGKGKLLTADGSWECDNCSGEGQVPAGGGHTPLAGPAARRETNRWREARQQARAARLEAEAAARKVLAMQEAGRERARREAQAASAIRQAVTAAAQVALNGPVEPAAPASEAIQRADRAQYQAAPIAATRGLCAVHLISATVDPLGALAAACRMYAGKPTYSLKDVTDDERQAAWEDVQKTHLQAPLEFVDLHFFIEGVTRSFTHQMVRQRTAVYAQESLRFAVKDRLAAEIGLPPSLSRDTEGAAVWYRAVAEVAGAYNELVGMGVPAEDARGLLPHATPTRLHYKSNLRALAEHAGNRLCTQAQFEWRAVWLGILAAMRARSVTGDGWQWQLIADSALFRPVCYRLGHCGFEASFDRGCTIRSRVNEGKFHEIRDEEWLNDPNAGRTA